MVGNVELDYMIARALGVASESRIVKISVKSTACYLSGMIIEIRMIEICVRLRS